MNSAEANIVDEDVKKWGHFELHPTRVPVDVDHWAIFLTIIHTAVKCLKLCLGIFFKSFKAKSVKNCQLRVIIVILNEDSSSSSL